MDDGQHLERYLAGDRAAIEPLIRRHMNLVYSTARRLVPEADADDVTQAVFLLLIRKAQHISPRQSLVGWLYQATRLVAANVRKQAGRRRRHQEASMQNAPRQTPTTEHAAWLELLDLALARLNDPERTAVLLHHLQGQSYDEAGAILGATAEAVRKRADRGLEKLRQLFAGRGYAVPTSAATTTLATVTTPAPAQQMLAALALAQGATASAHVAALAAQVRLPLALTTKAALAAGYLSRKGRLCSDTTGCHLTSKLPQQLLARDRRIGFLHARRDPGQSGTGYRRSAKWHRYPALQHACLSIHLNVHLTMLMRHPHSYHPWEFVRPMHVRVEAGGEDHAFFIEPLHDFLGNLVRCGTREAHVDDLTSLFLSPQECFRQASPAPHQVPDHFRDVDFTCRSHAHRRGIRGSDHLSDLCGMGWDGFGMMNEAFHRCRKDVRFGRPERIEHGDFDPVPGARILPPR